MAFSTDKLMKVLSEARQAKKRQFPNQGEHIALKVTLSFSGARLRITALSHASGAEFIAQARGPE